MKPGAAVALVAVAVALGGAAPAFAHEEVNPSTLPTGQPVFLVLTAADETKADLVRITLTAPPQVPLGSATREPAGWMVSRSDTTITWTSVDGAGVKPDHFEQWGFETDGADQPGTFPLRATLGFADGTSNDVQIPVTVVAPGSPAGPPPPGVGPGPTNSATTGAPPVILPARAGDVRSAKGRAGAALAVGIVALVVGLAALGLVRRRTGAHGRGGAQGEESGQDW